MLNFMINIAHKKYEIMDFTVHGDHNGNLISLEQDKNLPFTVRRVYYIYDIPKNIVRGKHAHKKNEQIIICLSGSCDFILDDGKTKKTFHLNDPSKGLYIGSDVWREFSCFSPDCVIMVLASTLYDENDYIRDYNEFLRIIG